MSYLQRIKAYFYSEETKRSDAQLAHDFGEFPPWPLNCKGLDCNFVLVRTRGIGGMCVNLLLVKRFLQVRSPDEISTSLHDTWRGIQSARSQVSSVVQGLHKSISTPSERVLFFLVFVPMLVMASLFFIPWFVFKFTPAIVSLYRGIPRGLGYFVPMFAKETRIVIKADELSKRQDGDSIIAHEHLHLLQHRNGQSDNKKSTCGDTLIAAAWKDDLHLLYLLEQNEMEARLHEVVLSFYRTEKKLPLTVGGFISLLAGSKVFGSLVVEAVGASQMTTAPEPVRYHERSAMIAADFEWILLSIRDRELRRRFITEVLPVMYGNLIRYYGDEASSRHFLRQITRPNLHDDLYSPAAVLATSLPASQMG